VDRGQGNAPACAQCGAPPSPGQSFCESCGAVLSWTPDTGPHVGTAPAHRDDTPPQGVAGTDFADSAGFGGSAGSRGSGGFADSAYSADDIVTARSNRAARGRQYGAPVPEPARPAGPSHAGPSHAGTGPWADGPGTPDIAHPDTAFPVRPPAAGATAGPTAAPGHPAFDAFAAAGASEPSAAERARALLIPVADPEAAAPPSVAPVQPGRPITARPQVQGPQGQGDDGGAPCPWCGTGNRPDRHFCRRCALTMAGRPEDPARLPWWRRLPGLRDRQVPWAGERPRLRRGLGRILSWVAGVAVLALVVTAALNIGTAVQAVRDHFTKRAPISADSYKASHSYSEHGPELAFDKLNNTWWGPGQTQSGAGEWVEADFSQPTRLLDVVITSGESTQPSELSKSALPHSIEAVITTADGKTQSRFLTLDGASGGQTRAFRVGDVTAVRFILRSAYGASAVKQVALAEIEFFGPSSGSGS
jgi:hypothetical protein